MDIINKFWEDFKAKNELPKELNYSACFYFGDLKPLVEELTELILTGKKRATCTTYEYFRVTGEKLPEVDDYIIVTDFDNIPRCIIKDTRITYLKFKDMTFDLASKEGEDENLESWIEGHKRFFGRESERLGYFFNEESVVVFEEFDIVYKG